MSPLDHPPVMVAEVLDLVGYRFGDVIFDGTVGEAGHLRAALDVIGSEGRAVGTDLDPDSLAVARQRLGNDPRVTLLERSFAEIKEIAAEFAPDGFDRIFLDLGLTLRQTKTRFSFGSDAPLDFRLAPGLGVSAADLLAQADEKDLANWLATYGGERHARRIAAGIVARRAERPIRTTSELAEVVRRAYPVKARHGRLHVATRTFMALRTVVNRMGEALEQVLADGPPLLRPGGRMGVLAYHSGESAPTKRWFAFWASQEGFELVTRRAVRCTREEQTRNPGARSAQLRVLAAVGRECGS